MVSAYLAPGARTGWDLRLSWLSDAVEDPKGADLPGYEMLRELATFRQALEQADRSNAAYWLAKTKQVFGLPTVRPKWMEPEPVSVGYAKPGQVWKDVGPRAAGHGRVRYLLVQNRDSRWVYCRTWTQEETEEIMPTPRPKDRVLDKNRLAPGDHQYKLVRAS